MTASAEAVGAAVRPRWRSGDDQPVYARPALAAIVVLAAVLFAWGINRADYHSFYANSVRSMTSGWRAFFFGSFDVGNTMAIDKIPGFLWPQTISALIFGFHPWSLVLPQVIEGVVSVLVLYRMVCRWAGVNAALLASAAMLATPVVVGLFHTAVEDPMYTMCVLLAAEATQRAAERGRMRLLMLAGVWVGVGFQAKILLAWVVLPALALVYLVAAPLPVRRRLIHLGAAGLVTVVVSLSWLTAVTLTPAQDRPYVDGTTNNSAYSMAFGYNFLNRFSSLGISASSTGSVSSSQTGSSGGGGGGSAAAGGGAGAGAGTGSHGAAKPQQGTSQGASQGAPQAASHSSSQTPAENGWGKMFSIPLASQVGWLYPLAAIAVAFGLIWRRREPRTDPVRAGFLLWGGWLAMYFLTFSAGSVDGHTYYMGVVALPVAALCGGGIAFMWRAYRTGGKSAWALPASIAATAAWSGYLSSRFPAFQSWLEPTSIVLGAVAAVLLLLLLTLTRWNPRWTSGGRIATIGLLSGLAAILITPAVWAAQIFSPSLHYTMVGAVGPSASDSGVAAFLDTSGALNPEQQRVLTYTEAHQGDAEYTLATTNWGSAFPFILSAGADVLAMGGFTDDVPYPTVTAFQQLIDSGKVRFLLTGGAPNFGTSFGASLATNTTNQIAAWARAHCAPVTASLYGGVPQSSIPTALPANPYAVAPLALYECAPQAHSGG
jgi:4-amino-4-deoxy-L-arabinose transferase-like glycosyltransferase